MLGSNFVPYTKTLNNASVIFGETVSVGKDDFGSFINERHTFIDKSMLIKEFIESSDSVSLILRPRRFGKSTNLSMLRRFFEISHSQEEIFISKKRKLFEKLKISTETKIMENHLAKYPVIHISLKDLTADNWDGMIINLRTLVADLYGEYRYIIDTLYPDEKNNYQRILAEDQTYPSLAFALKQLSKYLQRYHKKQCIVLIDEYDSPMECAYNKGYFKIANEFFKNMFSSLLKSNDTNVMKAMLVGVLQIAKSGFLSGLNNIQAYPLHSPLPIYTDKFGFTSDEVKLLLTMREELQIEDIQKWYDGYSAGGYVHLYNPWSIINMISKGTLCPYWTSTGSTKTVKNFLWRASSSFKKAVEELLKGEAIADIKIQNDLEYLYLDQYQDTTIWTLLYYGGYLTMNLEKKLIIPNLEVRTEWINWVTDMSFFKGGKTVISMLEHLLLGNLDSFKNEFECMVIDTLSFYDVGGSKSGKNAEYVYHAFCLGMFVVARDRGYNVDSNREAGTGRYDVRIVPKSGAISDAAVVIEFKVVDDMKNLQNIAQKALNQIEEKQYRATLQNEVRKVLEIGIAFKGKMSCVLGRSLRRNENNTWSESSQ
ncbi:11380_t:CDS:2 [Funneliformis geosporum]|uniref:5732_t:CDS:1 n=1 Tax=Funneliformis geosporum TaxID=1117311 RepID=A0A9W4SCX4_9GLOM|nr:11380_t:CDS:2 [Funneliformis geosporum]CAI2164029.1 5732_t:CDS:2 [Funneliformis geosporum]